MKSKFTVFIVFLLLSSSQFLVAGQETHTTFIRNISFSPDGNSVAVGYGTGRCNSNHPEDYSIKIFNDETTEVLQTLTGGICDITSVAWSPDGTKLAASSLDEFGTRVWDAQTGELLSISQNGGQGNTDVSWQPPNGLQLASASVSNTIRLLDPNTGQRLSLAPIGGTDIDWSSDGTELASVTPYENNVYVANMITGQQTMILQGHTDALITVDWSPDSTKLASAGADATIRVWDASNGENLAVLSGHTDAVLEVKWSPDSRLLASASSDGTVRIWDVSTGTELEVFQYPGRVYTVDWKPTGDYIVFGGSRDDGQNATIKIEALEFAEGFGTPSP